jgi:two-component system LytT family sensor kinase
MLTLEKIRKYEAWFIAGAVVIYVVKRLFWYAGEFDLDVFMARRAGVPESTIWKDLGIYSHFWDTIFPTVFSGVFFLSAWYLFHYYVYPAISEKKFDRKTFILSGLLVLSMILSIYVYDAHKLHWRFRYDEHEKIIGFKVYSFYRNLYVFTDTIALFVILAVYEVFARSYYYLILKMREEGKSFGFLEKVLTAAIILAILGYAVFGKVPQLFWNGVFASFFYFPLIGLSVAAVQQIYFKQILPFIGRKRPEELMAPVFIAGALALAGSFFFEIMQQATWAGNGHTGFRFSMRSYKDIFIQAVAFSFMGVVIALFRRFFTKEKTSLKTAVFNTSAELSNLRAQINPHFLFNTLNTLYSVSLKENASQTADGIQKLGDMMRFMLNENHQDRIPLTKEIEYLENYIEIQKMRVDESHEIEIKVNIQQPNHDFMIAPMLLNPFIENAFKHGISLRNPSWIYITLTHDDKRIYFKVHNSLHHHVSEDPILRKANNGVGLMNVRKRLELIYTDRHTLDIQQSEHDYFISLTVLLS